MFSYKTVSLLIIFSAQMSMALPTAKIEKISGEVKVRQGLEEEWQNAYAGMLLEDIDTILTLEGDVVLQIRDNVTFYLKSNSILDIGDLRNISRRELFLFLMAEKVDKMEPRKEKIPLRIGNVSVVHGEFRSETDSLRDEPDQQRWQQEFNAAKAMYDQDYYANTIVKLLKIFKKHTDVVDCGEIHFYLGKSFESVDEPGQALDAYNVALINGQDCQSRENLQWVAQAQQAVERLKK